MKYPVLALFLFGCAQPTSARNSSGTGGNGGTTASTTGGTTGGQGDMAVDPNADLAGFVTRPDFGGADLLSAAGDMAMVCNPVTQSGCGAGLKCTLDPDVPGCVTSGAVSWGQVCGSMNSDDCASSLLCIGINSNTSTCHQFCSSDGDCKQPAPTGTPSGNVGRCLDITGFAYKVCSVPCDPKNPSTVCVSPLVCILGTNAAGSDVTNCEDKQANMTGMDNGDCSGATGCAPGFICVTETNMAGMVTATVCRKVCTAVGDCSGVGPGGYTCALHAPQIYGVCGPY